jgi:hypothetical protein
MGKIAILNISASEEGYRKDVNNKYVSDFIEASKNFLFDFLHKKDRLTISCHSKRTA